MPPDLIIFDCDGVLVDSEGVASSVIAAALSDLGWEMDGHEAMRLFIGMSITDMEPIIEARLGVKLALGWRQGLAAKLLTALSAQCKPIEGAAAMLQKIVALGLNWRIASNSSDEEMAVKFARCGFTSLTEGKAISAASVIARGGRAKPAPDIFLAAAASAGVNPKGCIVLEDSALGVRGAVAAGMRCYGFAPHGGGHGLMEAGATGIFMALDEIFGVLS